MSTSWSCSVPIAATKLPPRRQLAMSLLRFISKGFNLAMLSTSLHCLCYVGISLYRRRSKESLSKSNNGKFV
ncbi:hypothetical protein DY000_02014684 [Brassica cretica]|uniref:Uncharacterized protein n=1 Tax=Brassica cretica TaxID=69181 RepID=A0ABQ7CUR9_BRACR|nr:hypothetical protein DY000_02014684 [Brassica cretica]